MIPPTLYIDGFMKFLERQYYVALLSAAAHHGAAHQQPQEFYVMTTPPAMRPTQRRGMKVNYISKASIEEQFVETHKVETGYIKISSPALTAFDLVQFERRCGGLNRVATILNELAESLKPEMFTPSLLNQSSTYAIQRLGFILDRHLNQKELAQAIFEVSQENNQAFYRVSLKTSAPDKGYPSDEKWKIIVNTEIEIDE